MSKDRNNIEKVQGLITKLVEGRSKQDRRKAAQELGAVGNSAAVDPLIGVLKDPDWDLRGDAAVRYLWANQNDCCNGKGKVRGFQRAYDFNNPAFITKAVKC